MTKITAETGRLDVLVNNAGHHEDSLLGTMTEASWRNVLASNLDAVFHGCQAALPAMIPVTCVPWLCSSAASEREP